MYLLVEQPADW